jgi:hypothetical protein
LIGKSIGSTKRELVSVIAIVTRLLKKNGMEFLDDFEFFCLLELVRCRDRRRNGHASARRGEGAKLVIKSDGNLTLPSLT